MFTRRLSCFALAAFLLVAGTGCAVLTRGQVAEVGKFAAAARNYGELPGAVIERHAAIRKERQVLRVATYADADQSLAAIDGALRQEYTLTEKGRQADQALQVLADYADLLIKLTADSYTSDLETAATGLAQQVDRGVAQYNKSWNSKVGVRGATMAALVRGAGGIYLRARQERALKEVVAAADPLVAALTRTVEETMALYLDADQLKELGPLPGGADGAALVPAGLLAQERKDVALFYRGVAGLYQGKQPIELPLKVAEVMESSDTAAQLAARALKGAANYRQAHADLNRVLQERRTLTTGIEQVQALNDEVMGAQALQKKLYKK